MKGDVKFNISLPDRYLDHKDFKYSIVFNFNNSPWSYIIPIL